MFMFMLNVYILSYQFLVQLLFAKLKETKYIRTRPIIVIHSIEP